MDWIKLETRLSTGPVTEDIKVTRTLVTREYKTGDVFCDALFNVLVPCKTRINQMSDVLFGFFLDVVEILLSQPNCELNQQVSV